MPLAAIIPFIGAGASALAGGTLGTIGTIAGLGLGAAATGLEIAGNAEDQRAENNAREQTNLEEQALQKKASQALATNVQANTPDNVNKELSTAAGNRANAWEGLNDITAPVASALPATTGASSPASNAQKTSSAVGNTWNNLVGGDAAKMGSYSDLATEQGIQDQNTAQQLGEFNNFAQGDAGLLPLEMDVASQRGGQLSGWGQIVGALGNLASAANQAGKFGTNAPQVPGQVTYGPYSGTPGDWSNPAPPSPTNWSETLPMGNQSGNVSNFWSTIYQ